MENNSSEVTVSQAVERKVYSPPAIVQELRMETQAGSPFPRPSSVDPLGVDPLGIDPSQPR